jgi:GAF domain-containing protein
MRVEAMERRSRAGGKVTKARSRKALKLKPPKASKAVTRRGSVPAGPMEVARLSRELDEAREQQTGTSEVLEVISRSPGDVQPVFAALLEKAVRICDATFGNIFRYDGAALHLIATHNTPPALAKARAGSPLRPSPNGPLDRMLKTKKAVHVVDVAAEKTYTEQRHPTIVAAVELGGVRTILFVPLLKGDELIGVFSLQRQEVRHFTDKQIDLVKNFAAQAVIAIENARLLDELRQSLQQQTATSEVLQAISRSPGELEPVFTTMLEKAVRICAAGFGNIYRWDGTDLHLVAAHNTPPAFTEVRARLPNPAEGPIGRMVATKSVVHVPDLKTERIYLEQRFPAAVDAVELGGVRTFLSVPMLKEGELIGAILLNRPEVRPFSNEQIALVKNFAAQAVIAIENARLLGELRQRTADLTQRTTDLTESLEQQTATSEVLQVISSSPGDLAPVFATMLENAVRICDAKFGNIYRWDGEMLLLVATQNTPPEFAEVRRSRLLRHTPNDPVGRMIGTKALVHTADLSKEPEYIERSNPALIAAVELGGVRTSLQVPILKEDELIGALSLSRQEVRPFTDKQIELLKNFAAQAVIAIENARLLNELRESLEEQTATSDVLKVISTSPGELQPVFDAMLAKAARICDASFGNIFRRDGDGLHLVGTHNTPPALAEARRRTPVQPDPNGPFGRMLVTKTVVHIPDLAAEDVYAEQRHPGAVTAVELGGVRTVLLVPMLKENELVGVFSLYRQEVRPFTDKQIALVQNFASQAVIAIENARLLNELRESLQEQTATSEVLQVINSSPGDLEPVFAAMLEKAVRICDATFGNIYRWRDNALHLASTHNTPPGYAEHRRRSPMRFDEMPRPMQQMVQTQLPVQVDDVLALDQNNTIVRAGAELGAIRIVLYVPMVKEGELIGAFILSRQEVRSFTRKEIELVKNFAAQAVIAIENARLLKELRERTEEVVKLNSDLERRVADQVGEIERMGRLRRFLPPQVADLIVATGAERQLESHRREITALFCDLRGFTGFTESADAEDVIALLREYHAAIGEKIIKYSGTLERYAGDGVMVVFNDPVPVENPALQAVLMALEMRNAIGGLTETWHRWGHDIGFGIGIAHGFATLGTIGFEGRFDYAAIGTVSNVAARLCDEAKSGQILISPRVLTKVENAVKVEPVGEFELKGIRRPIAAYNVLSAASTTH